MGISQQYEYKENTYLFDNNTIIYLIPNSENTNIYAHLSLLGIKPESHRLYTQPTETYIGTINSGSKMATHLEHIWLLPKCVCLSKSLLRLIKIQNIEIPKTSLKISSSKKYSVTITGRNT